MNKSDVTDRWDLMSTYDSASHLFLGSIMWVESASDLTVDTQGYRLSAQSSKGLQLEALPVHAQRYVVTVEELYKGDYPEHVQLVTPVVEGHEWIVDDLSPDAVHYYDTTVFKGPLTGAIDERGLFVVEERATDGLHVLVRVWDLEQVGVGLDALRLHAKDETTSLEDAIHQILTEYHGKIEILAAEEDQLRRKLDAILMVQDLAERKSKLEAYIQNLGYDKLWSYEEYLDDRYKQQSELIHKNQELPTRPSNPIEALWHDATQEIERIDIILKARAKK